MSDDVMPYDESPFPGWAAAVNSWPWHPNRADDGEITGWIKAGSCPRCGDRTLVELGLIREVSADEQPQIWASCQCSRNHQEDMTGCGAGDLVDAPTSKDERS